MKKLSKLLSVLLIAVFCTMALTACSPNSDPNKAKSSLEKAGYTTLMLSDVISLTGIEVALGCGRRDVTATLAASKVNEDKSSESIFIIYFKDAAAAKNCWDKAKSYIEKEEKDDGETDFTVKRSGKMIYGGTKAAIDAAK